METDIYLADLEERIDAEEERRIIEEWREFIFTDDPARPVFTPVRRPVAPSKLNWPEVNVNDAILDPSGETMLLGQLCKVNDLITSMNGYVPMIRANYGSTILATVLGCQLYMMQRDLNILPTVQPLSGGSKAIRQLVDKGVPDINNGQGREVFDATRFFVDKLNSYPKLRELVRIYHPDWQGPLDICELVYGSEIFLAFYDEPELMRQLLDLSTATYISFADRYFELFGASEECNFHYGWMHRGKIRISLDSCVNFSPAIYRDFVLPYDRRLFDRYGGIVHSCGKVDHFVEILPELGEGYHGFDLSQPHLNDMEKVYKATVDRGIRIFNLHKSAVTEALDSGRELYGRVHSPM